MRLFQWFKRKPRLAAPTLLCPVCGSRTDWTMYTGKVLCTGICDMHIVTHAEWHKRNEALKCG
jgi:hypothetical protein